MTNPAPDPGEYTSAATSIYNAMQSAANQAANQKRLREQEAQAGLQRQFENELQLQKEGAQKAPLSQDPYVAPAGRPTLMKKESQVPGGDPNAPDAVPATPAGQTIREPKSGVLHTNPTDLEKGKTFVPQGQLADMLEMAGHERGKPMTPADSHTLMEAINLAVPKDEAVDLDTSGKFRDAQGNPVAVMIGKKTGKVRMLDLSGLGKNGSASTAQSAPGGGGLPGGAFDDNAVNAAPAAGAQSGGPFSFQLPEKTERKETPDDWIRMITDPATDPKERARATAALELARKPGTESDKDRDLTRANLQADRAERMGERAQDRQEKLTATFRGFEKTKTKAIKDAVKEYRKSMATAITPEDKTAHLNQLRSDIDDAQKEYEGAIGDETGQTIPHSKWAQAYDPDAPGDGATPKTPPPKVNGKAHAQAAATPAQQGAAPAAPPASATQNLGAGVHTFGNGQTWRKGADGKMTYLAPPPADVTKDLPPGVHTFGNGQSWRKGADGTMTFVSGPK
jgi:hypothetical protein